MADDGAEIVNGVADESAPNYSGATASRIC
jgi:hypothetical protein